jgi:hypothetical protein
VDFADNGDCDDDIDYGDEEEDEQENAVFCPHLKHIKNNMVRQAVNRGEWCVSSTVLGSSLVFFGRFSSSPHPRLPSTLRQAV